MITLKNITKTIKDTGSGQILFTDISYSFHQDSSYIISGTSGIGKSTLLSIIAGFDIPTTGSVLYSGKNIHAMSAKQQSFFRTKIIGFLFQKSYLIAEISVLENVMLPLLLAGHTVHHAEKQAKKITSSLQLTEKLDKAPGVLSGGEQQRVSLARAVANNPLFLFVDEPTAFLDQNTSTFITKWLFDYRETHKNGLIMIVHDQSVYHYAQHVLVLKNQQLESLRVSG